jgi:hypothetical protein
VEHVARDPTVRRAATEPTIGGGTPGGRNAIVNESIVNESILIAEG